MILFALCFWNGPGHLDWLRRRTPLGANSARPGRTTAKRIIIPPNLGVIGFDDIPASRMAGLSSVRPPIEALGAFAAESVLRATEGEHRPVHTVLLQSKVIEQSSTRR